AQRALAEGDPRPPQGARPHRDRGRRRPPDRARRPAGPPEVAWLFRRGALSGRNETHPEPAMSFETLIVERDEAVTLIRLNRPQALNALNSRLLQELAQALDEAEADEAVRCLVLTGSERA